MELFANLWMGFGVAVSPINLLYAFIGCILGTLIGVLPGIGPVATIAMLLPITFNLNPVAALGSFFAGCVATLVIAVAAPPLAEVALKFGPSEYFSLMVFGLIAATVLAHGSLIKAIAMVVWGLLFGIVGTDVNSG